MLSNTLKWGRLGVITAAAASLAVPIVAHAQEPPLGYPMVGPYVGLSGGLNLKGSESIKNLSPNFNPTLGTGLSTPNLNFSTDVGGAAIAAFGWGFGNGLRAEVEFDYRSNTINKLSGQTPAGFGASTKAGGREQLWGPMVNVLYDFVGLSTFVVP
jgi:OOP family OmpA-OmpF porin